MGDGAEQLWQFGRRDVLADTNCPEQIGLSNVTAIAAANYFTLFLKKDGSLWGTGINSFGELGDGTYNFNTNNPEQIVSSNVTAIVVGEYHSLFLRSDGSLWAMGYNGTGQLGDGTLNETNQPEMIVPPGYNLITGQFSSDGRMRLSFVSKGELNYALDRSASLSPPNWIPQATNPANAYGALVFTNTLDPTTNNFWRIRSVP